MSTLTTSRLVLRPCSPMDRADFMALEADPQVMRFLNGGQGAVPEQGDPDAPYLMPRGHEPYVWAARRHTGAFVGWFCLWPDSATEAELGYRLRRQDWGQGLAVEGGRALIDFGFATCGYDSILASTMAVHHASRRVMEKLGMTYSHTEYPRFDLPLPGASEGEVWYRLIRPNGGARAV